MTTTWNCSLRRRAWLWEQIITETAERAHRCIEEEALRQGYDEGEIQIEAFTDEFRVYHVSSRTHKREWIGNYQAG